MTKISDLPRDVVEEIITRVPWKSMRTARLTCKKWNNLYKSRSFTKMHLGGMSLTLMIVMIDYNLCLMNVDLNGDPSIGTLGKLTFLHDSEQVKLSHVFHCEGTFLCILNEDNSRLVGWNPYSGQTRWIEPRYSYRQMMGWDPSNYALGYVEKKNKSCRSHKILRFIDCNLRDHKFSWYEIYNFDFDSWTTLDVNPHWCIESFDLGLSLKGNTYWLTSERNPQEDFTDITDHIICFDFRRERFGPLMHLPFSAGDDDYAILSCVREEKLSVLLQNEVTNPHLVEIWITTKIEADKVSWSKFLTVYTGPDISFTIESFIIDEDKKVSLCLDFSHTLYIIGEAGYFRELDLVEEPAQKKCYSEMFSYAPSLVQIKRPAGGKRKLKSSLEKRRYGQKTSKLYKLCKKLLKR